MRLGNERPSNNIEDRRGSGGGGGFGMPIIGGGIGTIVIAVLALLFGVDPRALFNGGGSNGGGSATTQPQQAPYSAPTQPGAQGAAPADRDADEVARILHTTEDVWHAYFRQNLGRDYTEPRLVLFTDSVQSACGMAESASGPFYCPSDQKVYIDLAFYRELSERFGAPGDFAQAYVIAHEVGHHVQNLLGTSEKVHDAEVNAGSRREAAALSVRLELQADCYAGVWGNHAQSMKNILDPGDLDEALNAASAIGDDRLQKMTRGRVTPETFTHGSSAQRREWFKRGFDTGDLNQCDTFR
jgi:predicted metalloprotease